MSDDYKKDKLEDLFKDSLEGLSNAPAENGWDMPSDELWERVDATLRPDKKDRRVLIWWFLGLALLGMLTAGIFLATQTDHDAGFLGSDKPYIFTEPITTNNSEGIDAYENAEELSELTIDITGDAGFEGHEKKEDHTKNSSDLTDRESQVPGFFERSERLIDPEPSAQRQRPVNRQNNPAEKARLENPEQVILQPFKPVLQDSSIQKTSMEKANKQPEKVLPTDTLTVKRKIVHVDILDILPLKLTDLTYASTEYLPLVDYHPNETIVPLTPKMRGFYIGLETSVLESYRSIVAKGEFVVPRFYEEEEPDISWGYGFNVGYQFSKKWSLEAGLNYTSSELAARSRRQIRYTMVDEQPNDVGELQRNYDFTFNTSNGTIESDVAVARSESTNISENDFIGIILTGKQNFSYLNVPILVRYHLGQGRWQLGLKAGLVNRFLLNATFQFESIDSQRPGIRLVVNDRFFQKRTLENINAYQADFEVGAGLRFLMTDQLSFYAEPTFRRSINPSHEGQNFKTFPTVKAIEFGMNWRF